MKKILKSSILSTLLDILFSPLTLLASFWLKYCRFHKPKAMPVTEAIFMKTGVLPIIDHYYQPLINPKKHLTKSLRDDRILPGLNWNIDEQLELLSQFQLITNYFRCRWKKLITLNFIFTIIPF